MAVDTSTLIGPDNFYQRVVPFVKTFAASINIRPNQTQFAFESFAGTTSVQFYLGRYRNSIDTVNAINPYYGGGTRNTADALDTMANDIFQTSRGARSGSAVNRIGVIVTYGGSVNSTLAIASAIRAKDTSIKLIVVAVGVFVRLTD